MNLLFPSFLLQASRLSLLAGRWSLVTGRWSLLLLLPLLGYGPAWFGHMVFERNKPATFGYPLYSLACDWIMMKDLITGRLPLLGPLPVESYDLSAQEAA